ncbi:hyaluronidase-3 [Plectropomus leopardus]|uniref:hyaluronidase-3 n=1 Tax=Plectropomus leopardus TaxID=160734 RepID=UPI001C4CDF01|nr:hyaluronidase-3 [Plectropomus leopardus]XP_042348171.1 hyaluronidase-3 [Plectropomus leopardus]
MVLSLLPLPFLLLLLLFLSPLPCTSLSPTSSHGSVLPDAPLPAVAAAGPVLQERPFVVVWNMPTEQCHRRFSIHLDLGSFDIVENRQQRFQGQKMTIFYRDRLGKYPYLSRGGTKVNGGIPQLSDLLAHLSLASTQISSLLQPNFTGLAVIDWEEWQPLWESNFGTKREYQRQSKLLVRQERPDLSERAMASLARQKFEECARKFMEETLRSMVRDRPKGLWGFYGFPACLNKQKRTTDKSYTGRCHKGTKNQNDRLSWLWRQSTAVYPSIYLPQRLAGSTDAALMVRHRLLEALRVASVWRHGNNTNQATPVLPYARLAFTHTLTFLNKTDLVHTLGESAALGAAGVVLWGELKFAKSKHQCILLRDYVHTVLGPFVQSLRSDTKTCSLQLCHSKGRCVRRRPSSSHTFSSGPAMTSDPNDSNPFSSGKPFHNHFMCQCYPGWTGQECQQKKKEEETKEKSK